MAVVGLFEAEVRADIEAVRYWYRVGMVRDGAVRSRSIDKQLTEGRDDNEVVRCCKVGRNAVGRIILRQ